MADRYAYEAKMASDAFNLRSVKICAAGNNL
jgi:hypothetical protein